MGVRIHAFSGLAPRSSPRELAENQAQVAHNARLTSGALEPLFAPKTLLALEGMTGPAMSGFVSITDAGARVLAWPVAVDAVRALVAGDRTGRCYFTGDGVPQFTNYALAGRDGYPAASRVLGLPTPATAPAPTFTGASGTVVNRAFVWSYVSADGSQESQMSAASAPVAGRTIGTWNLGTLPAAPPGSYTQSSSSWTTGVLTVTATDTFGLRVGDVLTNATTGTITVASVSSNTFTAALAANPGALSGAVFTRKVPYETAGLQVRVYWSEADGSYLLAGAFAAGATSVTIDAATAPLGVNPLDDAPMPPADLFSLTRHSSGALVGISGNELCMSLPYKPYAWPQKYRTPLAATPVACRAHDRSIVVGTLGGPEIFVGVDPDSMVAEETKAVMPCVSARSMVATGGGVAYATPYGLAWEANSDIAEITTPTYSWREWRALLPSTMAAVFYDGAYVGLYKAGLDPVLWWFDPGEIAPVSTANAYGATGLLTHPQTGALMLLAGTSVLGWEGDITRAAAYTWESKEFVLDPPSNIGAVRVNAQFSIPVEERNALALLLQTAVTTNLGLTSAGGGRGALAARPLGVVPFAGSELVPLPSLGSETLALELHTAEHGLVFSTTVTSTPETLRPPSDAYYSAFSIRLTGTTTVHSFSFANTPSDLPTQG